MSSIFSAGPFWASARMDAWGVVELVCMVITSPTERHLLARADGHGLRDATRAPLPFLPPGQKCRRRDPLDCQSEGDRACFGEFRLPTRITPAKSCTRLGTARWLVHPRLPRFPPLCDRDHRTIVRSIERDRISAHRFGEEHRQLLTRKVAGRESFDVPNPLITDLDSMAVQVKECEPERHPPRGRKHPLIARA